jgi:hypothetical protein
MIRGFLGTVFITIVSGIILFSTHIYLQRTDALESADYTRLVLSELNFQALRIRQGFFRTLAYAEEMNLSHAVSVWHGSLLENQGPVRISSLRLGRVPSTRVTLLCLQLDYLIQNEGTCGAFTIGENLTSAVCTRADRTYPLLNSLIWSSENSITFSGVLPTDEREGCSISRTDSDKYMIFGNLSFFNEIVSAFGILPGESISLNPTLKPLELW